MSWRIWAGILTLLLVAVGCTSSGPEEPVVIEVWFHHAEGPERILLEDQVRRFNEQRDGVTALLRVLPEESYAGQVAEATDLGELPDLLDVNRMMLATGAAAPLRPVGRLLPPEVRRSLVPELVAVGRVGGQLLAVPVAAHTVLLGADLDALRNERLPVPGGPDDPWTLAEMREALASLTNEDEPSLQLPGERSDLAAVLEVLVRSAGGSLITGSRSNPAAVEVATVVGGWLEEDLAVTAPDGDEVDDSVGPPLTLAGSESLPDNAVVSPPPDFGAGVASAPTGFAWAVPEGGEHEAAVVELLSFLLRAEEAEATAEVTGGVPVVRAAVDAISRGSQWRRARVIARLLGDGFSKAMPADENVAERLGAFADDVLEVARGEASPAAVLRDAG